MRQCGVAGLSASTMALDMLTCMACFTLVKTADHQERLFRGLIGEGVAQDFEGAGFSFPITPWRAGKR